MTSIFLPEVKAEALEAAKQAGDDNALWDMFIQPLHEELYRRQDFNFLDDLSEGQQLLISYDYVQMQVLQGGFIQLIQNGYIGLLPTMPGWLEVVGCHEMAKVIDNVLKVYVLNREELDKQTSVEEFARLYDEFQEFVTLDEDFHRLHPQVFTTLLQYAIHHTEEFLKLV
ncbi:MAG: DUF4375 domain-containing protein [Chitinophagales bacterium]|nr:DUF4375 domain-containing protein [Chitinophagales bacterium]